MSRFTFAISILVAVVSVVAFTACSGGDDSPLSEDEYFDTLGELASPSDVAAEVAESAGEAPDDPVLLSEWLDASSLISFRAMIDAHSDYIEELEAMRPPDTLRDVHALYLSATRASLPMMEEFLVYQERIDQDEDISDETFESWQAVGVQFNDACNALEDAAIEASVSFDLGCLDNYP